MHFQWGHVSGGVFAFFVIMLLLAPAFWFLWDTDRFTRWIPTEPRPPYWFLALAVLQAGFGAYYRDWWRATLWAAMAILCVVEILRLRRARSAG